MVYWWQHPVLLNLTIAGQHRHRTHKRCERVYSYCTWTSRTALWEELVHIHDAVADCGREAGEHVRSWESMIIWELLIASASLDKANSSHSTLNYISSVQIKRRHYTIQQCQIHYYYYWVLWDVGWDQPAAAGSVIVNIIICQEWISSHLVSTGRAVSGETHLQMLIWNIF